MSMTDTVRAEMVKAMKEKDKDRKDALSAMLTVLKNGEIEKREPLTEDEAVAILKKELKHQGGGPHKDGGHKAVRSGRHE